MANCSDQKNPLHNNGTSQSQRLLAGLDRNVFAVPDEKGFADWIVFANNFAAFINYYNTSNKVVDDANWQPFFSSDISAHLGTIAIQNIESYRQEIKEHFDFIRDDDNESAISDIKIKLNDLFSVLLTLSKALDYYVLKLSEQTALKQNIANLVKTKLAPALNSLIAYYKGAKTHVYIDQSNLAGWVILNTPLTDAAIIIEATEADKGLSNNWYDDTLHANWNTYINSIAADDSIYINPLSVIPFPDVFLGIEHAANHNLFTGIFDTYLSTYAKIVQEAEAELLKTLETYDAHTPHYALFLTFLMLFRFTQTHVNTITQRHLDFYYKEVLKLQPRAAQANKVHVLGELAKQVNSYLLAQGTALKAGKDSLKKDASYTLDNDAVFNKAKVTQLKTFYKSAAADTVYVPGTVTVKQNNTGRVFASPIANSDDGITAALTSDNKEWHPYIHKVYKDAGLESIAMPKALLGFALASHYLYLLEGERKVFVRFAMSDNAALNNKHIECWLTAEKEWFKVETVTIASSGKYLSDGAISCAEISFTIPGSAPPIVNYNAAKHGGTFNVALPMLKIYLVNEDTLAYEFDLLKDINITKTEIRVEVGMDAGYNQKGLKNLLVSNDYGVLDASKPFMPFGNAPTAGSRLVIGNKEIMSKKNAVMKLNLEWKGLTANRADVSFANLGGSDFPNISTNNLDEGIWKAISNDEIFDGGASDVKKTRQLTLLLNSFVNSIVEYEDDYQPYDINSNKGFVALQLTESFGHKEYLVTLTDYLVRKANSVTADDITLPVEPYTPMLQSVYASYSAYCINSLSTATESDFNNREINFFHLYPFGDGEQHAYLTPTQNVSLLPAFKHTSEGSNKDHIGELYIGIENLNPNDSVNMLFQVMEGTTNPTVAKPAEHILWSYLSNNSWIAFESSDYSDNTLELVQSGIISFAIPADATTTNTVLPTGYIWIKASVTEAAEAVCKLISVNAQAAVATFANNDNAPDFLDTALAAGTISKLKTPDAAVKKMIQPYSSFGGRAKENEDHFYIRVSERLRHKARAINVWDYEHLVLQAFPEIYKVKCLNHTQIEDGIYHEVKPGYVSIITIPSQQNRNDADPLKPYTQQSTLTKIENYLRKRTSCFVNLRACQPQFEEVRLEFSLKLFDTCKDFTFYANQLKEEITQFLSPWATGDNSTIDFGGKVYKSVLINFIEERYYVDFITDVFMYVNVEGTESADMDEITASTARSILVSASASKHTIQELAEADNNAEELCIDKNNIPQ